MNNTSHRMILIALNHILDKASYTPGFHDSVLNMDKKKDTQLFEIVKMMESFNYSTEGIYDEFDALWSKLSQEYKTKAVNIFEDMGLTGKLWREYKKQIVEIIEKRVKQKSNGQAA